MGQEGAAAPSVADPCRAPAPLPARPAVIDNLVKGASGQAIQNMNLLFGLPEETALMQQALFP